MKKSTAIIWGSLFTLGSISALAADNAMGNTPQPTMEQPHMEKKMPMDKQSMDKSMKDKPIDKPMAKPMDAGMEKPSSMTK